MGQDLDNRLTHLLLDKTSYRLPAGENQRVTNISGIMRVAVAEQYHLISGVSLGTAFELGLLFGGSNPQIHERLPKRERWTYRPVSSQRIHPTM